MFSVGQRVWHRDGQRNGTVVELAGDRVYIVQDNGVELDFRASDLTSVAPNGSRSSAPRPANPREPERTANYTVPTRRLTAGDITPEHVQVLAALPVRTLQAVAALHERKPGAGKFSALSVAEKLNIVAETTATPYRIMRQYRDSPGELGLIMGKGLADSRRGG